MPRRLFCVLVGLTLLAAVFCAGASAAARFYTADYGSSTPEEIGGFELGANGSLAPIPGSPFPAAPGPPYEPAGIWGLGFTPDGARAVSGFLFYGGVQGYAVPASGIFSLAGSAIATPSVTSLAVSPDGRFAFAPTRDFGGATAEGIRRFAIQGDGSLTALAPSGGSGEYGDVVVTPDGRFLFAAQFGKVERFGVGADGLLTSLGSTPAPTPQFMSVSPDGRFLFIVPGGGGGGLVSFAIDGAGGLTQRGPGVPIPGSSPDIPGVTPDGRFVYVPDSNNGAVFAFSIATDGTPTLAGGTPVDNPESVAVSPDGRHLVFYRGGGSENALGVAAIGADGIPVLLPFETPWTTGEPERIVFQPHPTPVASFKANPAAPGEPSRFDAGASARAARYDWSFGDGTTLLDGGPRPAHVYAAAGAYEITLTVTDSSGCSTRHFYTGQSTVCPGGPAARTTGVLDTAPAISRLRATPRKFKPKVRGVKGGGTTFRYSLTEVATVRFKFERKLPGRLVKGRCRPQTKGNGSKKKCPLFKRMGSRAQLAKAGANKLKFNGKLKGKPLPPGSYRATVVATDKAGGRSTPKTVGFRVLPLPQQP